MASGAGTAATPQQGPVVSEGERRHATILFADLSGYTALNEALDPETVQEVVGRVKSIAESVVSEHGGLVNQTVGDEIVALFGFPVAHEDDQGAAVEAALALHAAVRELSDEVARRFGRRLAMHSGIATGLNVFTRDDERGGIYSVTGDTMNTAARLRSAAGPGEILVVAEIKRHTEGQLVYEELAPMALKGKARPLQVFRVVGRTRGHQGPADAARSPGAFTGRALEIAQLERALGRALNREGQVVMLVGPAGVGKSRVVREFLANRRGDLRVVTARCQPSGTETPYQPFLQILHEAFGVEDADGVDAVVAKVAGECRRLGERMVPHVPALLHLLSAPHQDFPLPENAQRDRLAESLRAAISAFFVRAAADRPLIIVLEDWQWADRASDHVLRSNLERIGALPILTVMTLRDGAEMSWPARSHMSIINLGPLERDDLATMIRGLFDVREVPAELVALLHQRTQGNPLFVEEIATTLREDEFIEVQGERLTVVKSLEGVGIPNSVQSAVLRRLDRIDPAWRELLRRASVIGTEFSLAVLGRLVTGDVDLRGTLDKLQMLEFVTRVEDEPDVRYAFKHAITQEVAYETLLLRQRRALHGVVVDAVEALYAGRIDEHLETLAFHASRAESPERAVDYLARAGDKAARSFALDAARSQYLAALAILETPDGAGDPRDEARCRARGGLALRLAAASQFAPGARQVEILRRCLADAVALDDRPLAAELRYWIGRMEYSLGQSAEAIAEFEAALALAESLGHDDLIGRCTCVLGRASVFTAEPQRGIAYLDRGVGLMRRSGNLVEVAYSTSSRACIEAFTGGFAAADRLFDAALHLAREHENRTVEALVLQQQGYARCLRGDWPGAREALGACHDIASRTGNAVLADFAQIFAAYAAAMGGDAQTGCQLMMQAMDRYEASSAHLAASLCYGWSAEVYAATGNEERARRHVSKSLECERNHDRFGRAPALRARAAIAFADGETAAGRAALEEALAFAQVRGARPDAAITSLLLARHLEAADAARAAALRAEATGAFRDMGMHWWLAQAASTGGRPAT
jgi:class 3 adenylate cyclase/tetratricopeptide (TPR) repeat protein